MTNPYHARARMFSAGNVTEENKPLNHRLMHIRVPRHIFNELERQAEAHGVTTGRLAIELLRSWATKQANKRMANEP